MSHQKPKFRMRVVFVTDISNPEKVVTPKEWYLMPVNDAAEALKIPAWKLFIPML